MYCSRVVLHRSAAFRNAPCPRWNSGGAFETWAAGSGDPVEHPNANLGLSLLISEGASFLLRPDDPLPATHEGFSSAALMVARGFLPSHPPAGCDGRDIAVSRRRILARIGAQDRGFRRWDRHLDPRPSIRTERQANQMLVLHHIHRPLPGRRLQSNLPRGGQKANNRAADLIKSAARQGGWVTGGIRGQIGDDNLATDKIEAEVQRAPRATFALGLMLFREQFITRMHIQSRLPRERPHRISSGRYSQRRGGSWRGCLPLGSSAISGRCPSEAGSRNPVRLSEPPVAPRCCA